MPERFTGNADIETGAERKETPGFINMQVVVIKITHEQLLGEAPMNGDEPVEIRKIGAQYA